MPQEPFKVGDEYTHNMGRKYTISAVTTKGNLVLRDIYDYGAEFLISHTAFNRDYTKTPKKIKRWVNLYPNGTASHWSAKSEADGFAGEGRLACIAVEFEEREVK